MDRLEVNPRYRDWLARQGLSRAENFLQLSGVICCGHPDRNVAHLTLGDGDMTLTAFLKKEHRVPWKDRLRNWLAGFGPVSKSLREARALRQATEAGVGCPEFIAAGEHGNRAFLLVREVNAADMRSTEIPVVDLGKAIAAMHARGIYHGDLFSKHILVLRDDPARFIFLDWQRARSGRPVSRCERLHELACLDATLAENLCTVRERLLFLKTYILETGQPSTLTRRVSEGRPSLTRRVSMAVPTLRLAATAREIRRLSERLCRKRYIREMRLPPLKSGKQNLIWLDGEALCVTKEFLEVATGTRDEASFRNHELAEQLSASPSVSYMQKRIAIRDRRATSPTGNEIDALLIRREECRFWTWLARCVCRRTFASPEVELAATLFRLERFGVPAPELLAVGQAFPLPWRHRSFVLLRKTPAQPLDEWRAENHDENLVREMLQQTDELLQRIHDAGYAVPAKSDPFALFAVRAKDTTVVLNDPAALRRTRRGQR